MTSTARALVVSTIMLVLVAFLPGLFLSIVGLDAAAGAGLLGAFAAFLAALLGGWRVGLAVVLPLAVAAGLAVAVHPNAWLAALLMLVVAGARDWLSTRGLHNALTSAVIAIGFLVADPPTSTTSLPDPLFIGLVVGAAALYGAGVVGLLSRGKHTRPEQPRVSPSRALVFAVSNGLLMAVATWFVIRLDLGHTGAWMLLTIVVVSQPYVQDGFDKALQRAGGTMLGIVAAVGVGALTTSPAILYIVGMAGVMATSVLLMQRRPYWLVAACLTLAIVMLMGASSSIEETAAHRLIATLVGVGAALAVTAAMQPFAKRTAQKHGLTHY